MTIQELIDIDHLTKERKERRKNKGGTQEFFTPWTIVEQMCKKIPKEDWENPKKVFLEPSFGNGNFILAIIYFRLHAKINWRTTLETLYGVELMEDNVKECKERVLDLLDKLQIKYDKDIAMEIMDKNLVCHDFFTWNLNEWRPMIDEEIKKSRKK